MKQIVVKNGEITVLEVPPPLMSDNHVWVANAFSVISSGTESEVIKGSSKSLINRITEKPEIVKKVVGKIRDQGLKKTLRDVRKKTDSPIRLGYASAGTVIGVGKNIRDISIGQRVACGGADAAHAEIIAVPRNLIARVPENIKMEEAAFATLGSIAMHGIRRANVHLGDSVVIMGLGLIGILGAQIAKAAGCRVIGIDISEQRVKLAKELGGDLVLNSNKADVIQTVMDYTHGFGADAVIIFTAGSEGDPANLAFELCRQKGKVVAVGSFKMHFNREKMYEKELDFLMSTSYGPGRYDKMYEEEGIDYPIGYIRWTENRNMEEFLQLISQGKINILPLTTSIYSIDEAKSAYNLLNSSGDEKPLAILLQYYVSPIYDRKEKATEFSVQTISKSLNDKINIAIVGAGNFTWEILLPALSDLKNLFTLSVIVTAHGDSAEYVAKKYNAKYSTTNYEDVLLDKDIDLIFICTRHNLHYPMVMKALTHQKAIFVEKPLCLTRKELQDIVKNMEKQNMFLTVGFNRRYSPLSICLKEHLKNLRGPFFISYRVNAGFIESDHWTQNPEIGGGRIIGEACHFIDYFNYLIGNKPSVRQISVDSIPIDGRRVNASDNLSAIIKYSDGSLAALNYSTLGHTSLEKERIEVFADGKSFVISDFKSLEVYGKTDNINYPPSIKIKGNRLVLSRQDKGIKGELEALSCAVRGEKSSIITFSEIVRSMELTFDIEERTRIIGQQSS